MRFALALLLLATPLAAQDSIEDRLKKLEQEVADLKRENEQLRRDLGVEVVSRQSDVKMNGRAEAVQLGGLVQVQGESGEKPDSRFSDSNERVFLRRARVNLTGHFVEEFNVRAEIELAGSLANSSGLRAQMTDAYVNWNRFDAANVRVGQFKTPFGFEQLYADPQLYTAERSLVSDRLTPGRQIGAQLGGFFGLERVNYAVGVFNGNGTNTNFNDNDRFMTAARVSVLPFSGRLFDQPARWSVGADGFTTRDNNVNAFTGRRRGEGIDTQFSIGPFELWAERLRTNFDPDKGAATRSAGAYGQLAYYVILDKLQLVARRETLDSTATNIFGFNYYFKQHDVKFQFDVMRGTATKIIARLQTGF